MATTKAKKTEDKKTQSPKKVDVVEIDAKDRPLGRLAAEIAVNLQGKHRPDYKPHINTGSSVKVKNASRVKVTGKKSTDKKYWRYSGYPGGIYSSSLQDEVKKDPKRVIEYAVWGMLPKNKLRKERMKMLIIEK